MSRNLPLVHAPVPNPLIRWAALVTAAAPDSALTNGLGDWSSMQVFHNLPADWPGDDPTLGLSVPAPQWIARGQGIYSGLDPQFTATVRTIAPQTFLIWKAIWLYDPSAPPLSNACPSPVCPPCPGGVTPPSAAASSGSSLGRLAALFLFGAAAGGAAAYAAGRKKRPA